MTFSELLKEIHDSSKERVKTPITGAYIFSFIIWNWRPLVLLIFENATVSEKIIVINNEYCNLMSILGPFFLSLFFTLGIPYLMVIINNILKPAKQSRIESIYQTKTTELNEQIKLVDKELALQDKKTRSKSTEDFENQINEMQKRIDNINESNKVVVEDYENKIKDLTNIIQKNINEKENEINSLKIQNEKNEFSKLMIGTNFSVKDFLFVKNISLNPNTLYNKSNISSEVYIFLKNNNFIETFNDRFGYTKKGIRFLQYIIEIIKGNDL